MSPIDTVRLLLDSSVGNRGAVANCRSELRRTRDAERAVDDLCRRLPRRDEPIEPAASA